MTEIEQKPDNSARPLLPGWRLWLRLFFMAGESGGLYYGPAFPACPECGSPNVRLLVRRRRKQGDRYQCLEWNCKNRRGPAEVTGSTGTGRRRAIIRSRLIVLVIFAVMLVLLLTHHLPNS